MPVVLLTLLSSGHKIGPLGYIQAFGEGRLCSYHQVNWDGESGGGLAEWRDR